MHRWHEREAHDEAASLESEDMTPAIVIRLGKVLSSASREAMMSLLGSGALRAAAPLL